MQDQRTDHRPENVDPDETVVGGVTHEALDPIKVRQNFDRLWNQRVERLLELALEEWKGEQDAIETTSAALTAMRIQCGEMPADEMAGFEFPGEDADLGGCTCSPEIRARGGFKGGCPVHG